MLENNKNTIIAVYADRDVYGVYRRMIDMAYPYSFIKLTFGGDLQDTDEVWTCGFHIGRESANTTQSDLENIGSLQITAMADSIKTFFTHPQTRVPSKYRLQWVKMAAIGTNGKYLGAPVEYYYTTPGVGSSVSGFVPQNSSVFTIVSDKFKDPGKYNRFYLPAATPLGAGNFKLTAAQTQDMATRLAVLLNDINIALTVELSGIAVRVVSQKSGIYRSIDHARVGDIIDTQRRRRNALREEYSEAHVGL